ncbi:hypothetical protein C8Q80DRAFT_1344830 [Daedaleopsis nitida]|nr:hypothetical protein C8Q80DRAFT_1344830 [Daedaleopsis nitida]
MADLRRRGKWSAARRHSRYPATPSLLLMRRRHRLSLLTLETAEIFRTISTRCARWICSFRIPVFEGPYTAADLRKIPLFQNLHLHSPDLNLWIKYVPMPVRMAERVPPSSSWFNGDAAPGNSQAIGGYHLDAHELYVNLAEICPDLSVSNISADPATPSLSMSSSTSPSSSRATSSHWDGEALAGPEVLQYSDARVLLDDISPSIPHVTASDTPVALSPPEVYPHSQVSDTRWCPTSPMATEDLCLPSLPSSFTYDDLIFANDTQGNAGRLGHSEHASDGQLILLTATPPNSSYDSYCNPILSGYHPPSADDLQGFGNASPGSAMLVDIPAALVSSYTTIPPIMPSVPHVGDLSLPSKDNPSFMHSRSTWSPYSASSYHGMSVPYAAIMQSPPNGIGESEVYTASISSPERLTSASITAGQKARTLASETPRRRHRPYPPRPNATQLVSRRALSLQTLHLPAAQTVQPLAKPTPVRAVTLPACPTVYDGGRPPHADVVYDGSGVSFWTHSADAAPWSHEPADRDDFNLMALYGEHEMGGSMSDVSSGAGDTTVTEIPQTAYTKGMGRVTCPPVKYGATGISLVDAIRSEKTVVLQGDTDTAFPLNFNQKISVRLELVGYGSFTSEQINVLRTDKGKRLQPSRAHLAHIAAKGLKQVIEKNRPPFPYMFEDLVLLEVRRVSQGSIQPIIGLPGCAQATT